MSDAPADDVWSPEAVQRLRARLGLSQAELAARVGTRQQTISEWETGTRAPRRMSRRLLRLVAEEAGVYDVAFDAAAPPPAPPREGGREP
jgi:DNA-binding transcriptional regulator YiaG